MWCFSRRVGAEPGQAAAEERFPAALLRPPAPRLGEPRPYLDAAHQRGTDFPRPPPQVVREPAEQVWTAEVGSPPAAWPGKLVPARAERSATASRARSYGVSSSSAGRRNRSRASSFWSPRVVDRDAALRRIEWNPATIGRTHHARRPRINVAACSERTATKTTGLSRGSMAERLGCFDGVLAAPPGITGFALSRRISSPNPRKERDIRPSSCDWPAIPRGVGCTEPLRARTLRRHHLHLRRCGGSGAAPMAQEIRWRERRKRRSRVHGVSAGPLRRRVPTAASGPGLGEVATTAPSPARRCDSPGRRRAATGRRRLQRVRSIRQGEHRPRRAVDITAAPEPMATVPPYSGIKIASSAYSTVPAEVAEQRLG